MSDDEHGEGRGLDAASGPRDYLATLNLKHDHEKKPLWVCPNGRIVLESGSPVEKEAVDFLVAIAEPRCRTRFLQEYQLTDYSLYAGASMGLRTSEVLGAMERFSKTVLPPSVVKKIHDETSRYGKVKLVMRSHQLFIECRGRPEVLEELRGPRGGRLRNCEANVDKRRYAFNALQVQALPAELRPPASGVRGRADDVLT